jgi:hypothetical protein
VEARDSLSAFRQAIEPNSKVPSVGSGCRDALDADTGLLPVLAEPLLSDLAGLQHLEGFKCSDQASSSQFRDC